MPLLGESCASDLKLFRPSSAPRTAATSVRRRLFASDDETRRRTDQWLDDQLALIKQDNQRKASYWGFDFENDVPMEVDDKKRESKKSTSPNAAADFEWTVLSADSVPSFYSRQVTRCRIFRTQDIALNSPVKQHPLHHCIAKPAVDLVYTLQPVKTGLVEALPAGWSETTPQKPPGEGLGGDESSSSGPDLPSTSATSDDDVVAIVVGQKRQGSKAFRRMGNVKSISSKFDDQSKLTSFYPLRKRIRRHNDDDDDRHHFAAKLSSGHATKSLAAIPPDQHQRVHATSVIVCHSDGGHSPPMTSSSSTISPSSSAVF